MIKVHRELREPSKLRHNCRCANRVLQNTFSVLDYQNFLILPLATAATSISRSNLEKQFDSNLILLKINWRKKARSQNAHRSWRKSRMTKLKGQHFSDHLIISTPSANTHMEIRLFF